MSSHIDLVSQRNSWHQQGFTLVEMLVAMAVTLLMMAALARAFGFIGEQVRDSRASLQMAGELRDVTTRISDELKRCTVSLRPNDGGPDQPGYFLYQEGPLTDATSSIFRATTDVDGNLELSDSRYGDFDDYIAFTAVAPTNAWFTGKVPRYLLEEKSAEVKGGTYTPTSADPDPFEPVVIKSRYAEIIYFASPEYDNSIASTDPDYPRFIDVDGDADFGDVDTVADENGLPDRLRIYRRVLLIRPDLNLTGDILPTRSNGTVTFMQTDAHPTNWHVAMAAPHQQCDLSIRRLLDTAGLPTNRVAANSLADLAKPHNRFAHVRIPNANLGVGTGSDTSMPVLSLGPPLAILGMNDVNGDRIAPQLSPNTDPVVTPANWSGFLRPEFVLGHDLIHADPADAWWSLSARLGEDLLVNNAIAFDVQIYDPSANWITDVWSGLVIGPNDAGYRESVNEPALIAPARISQGGFVDLAFPSLAGGSLRGWVARPVDRRSTSATASNAIVAANEPLLLSTFSAIETGYLVASASTAYFPSLYKSGHLVVDGSNRIRLFQPTFDTYTSSYERDGFLQDQRGAQGTIWTTSTVGADLGADGIDTDGLYGVDDINERETSPPIRVRPEAIRVTLRLENPSTRQIHQSSVTHRDDR